MNNFLKSIVLAVSLISSCVLFSMGISNAQERGCTIEATKSAPGAGDFEFFFTGTTPGDPIEFTLADGESTGGTIPEGVSVSIFEAPQNGYQFRGIDCDSGPGIVISNFEGGFSISCEDASDGNATCIIRNIPLISPIPTLSEWGMISAVLGLGIVGIFFVVYRRKTQATK